MHAGMPDPPGPCTPPGADTPPDQAPPREADARIRSMSGRYASYWNAFLFCFFFAIGKKSNFEYAWSYFTAGLPEFPLGYLDLCNILFSVLLSTNF